MECGSVFDFTGSAKMMRLRVTLSQIGLSENLNGDNLMESLISRAIDELDLQWQQKVPPPSLYSDIQPHTSRREIRLFTYVDGDELPQHLKIHAPKGNPDEETAKTGYDAWIAHNGAVDLPLRRAHHFLRCEKKKMYIMAYLGSLAGSYNSRDEHVVCRITLLNDTSMIFEPRLTHNGFRIQSKIGEYLGMVLIWDDYFSPIYDQLEVLTAPPILETPSFELPEEELTQFVSLMCIDYAAIFGCKTIWIEYVAVFPDGTTCSSNNTEGQTSHCTVDENGQFNFSIPIEFDFVAPKISTFHLRFRVRSEDFWGRQYIAGYATLSPLLSPGRTEYCVECWRPVKAGDNISELRELFIGQAIDIDFFNWKEDGFISRAGLMTHSSGTLHISITNIVQRRDYMSKETLNHMKYGAMFGRMGMRSDLYWRIMKVLVEFEDAKRQLLSVRVT